MRGRFLDDYTPGEIIETPGRTITEADVTMFAGLTGDYNELHTNRETMAHSQFGERLVHGLLGLSMGIGLFFRTGYLEGTVMAFLGMEEWTFSGPLFIGDTITAKLTVKEVRPSKSKPDRGIVKVFLEIINQKGETTQNGTAALMIQRKQP